MLMGQDKLLEAGIVANTHGISGELKIQPWADTPAFLTEFERFFIDGSPIIVKSARVHKNCVIVCLDGVDDINSAIKLKNKTIFISRDDFQTDDGRHLIIDLIGLSALNSESGEVLGKISEVLTLPSNDVYVIRGEREILVPAVPDFVDEVNIKAGYVKIRMREGL